MLNIIVKENGREAVVKNLSTTDDRVRTALGVGLARGLLIAVGVAQVSYLTGPRPEKLSTVTTRLRNSLTAEVSINNNLITGRIGTNVPYGARWEFGFHGVEHVKAHTRVTSLEISNGTVRIVHEGGSKKMARKLKRNDIAGVTFVRAHDRKIDSAGKPFLQPALAATDIGGEINKELKKVANG